MKNVILALLLMAIAIPTLTAQPAGYDENFRKIGEDHNKIVRYILNLLSSNPTMEEVKQLTSDAMADMYDGANVYDAYKRHAKFKRYVDDYHKAKDKVAYVSRSFSPQAKEYFAQIIAATDAGSHDQLVNQMEGIIESVISSSLKTSEKNALLYGASTGINSSALWRGMEGALIWKNSSEAPPQAKVTSSATGDIIKNDVAGAAGGAAGSATVTWVLGPGVVPASGAAGLFVGSSSSVATGVVKLWNWVFGD